jgi:hypothetical protein
MIEALILFILAIFIACGLIFLAIIFWPIVVVIAIIFIIVALVGSNNNVR